MSRHPSRFLNAAATLVILCSLLLPAGAQPGVHAAVPASLTYSGAAPRLTEQMPLQTLGVLYRAIVAVPTPARRARLGELGVTILSEGSGNAVVLADADQLEALTRLRFEPIGSDDLGVLVNTHAQEQPWLALSLRPLLAQAETAANQAASAATVSPTVLEDLHAAMRGLTTEQMTALAGLTGIDDDADGLTNTQEAWWCTDPLNPDTDMDGRSDGAEIQALKDWMGNRRAGPPGETPWPSWPFNATTCPDKDQDSIPNLAERWELGLNMDLESSDRDKFDDGQELFGVTYCPGGDLTCGYGDLPRSSDSGYVGAAMPSWVKAPGNHPLVAAFPVVKVDVAEDSLTVDPITVITTELGQMSSEAKTYQTDHTQGSSTAEADTITWNDWEEISHTTPDAAGAASVNSPSSPSAAQLGLLKALEGAAAVSTIFGNAKNDSKYSEELSRFQLNDLRCSRMKPGLQQVLIAGAWIDCKIQNFFYKPPVTTDQQVNNIYNVSKDYIDATTQINQCYGNCAVGVNNGVNANYIGLDKVLHEQQDRMASGNGQVYYGNSAGQLVIQPKIEVTVPAQRPSTTIATGSERGGAKSTTTTQYSETTITEGEQFTTGQNWNTATAVDSAHAADLWFTYKVRNTGTEYAREIANLAFNVYIGDGPNPVYTYFVGPDLGGDGKFRNFMPAEEHTYTARRVPLTLEQMKAIDLGGPMRVVVEDFTYGADELFYQDAANASVLLAIEDGTADGDEVIDTYLIPTWGEETVLDVLARYFPHDTDENDALVAIWTPEYRSDTPAWCDDPKVVGTGNQRTLWCRHALSTADWWNVYTNGMGDGSEGFQDTPASRGSVALFRFNSDSDLDGYSDRSEERLGTDPNDPGVHPKPELIAGLHSVSAGNNVVATLSLLNTGIYDAYGVEAVMIAPDDSVSVTNNTVGGSGRVKAGRQVIVGSRILPAAYSGSTWSGSAKPSSSGYYTGTQDLTYTFTAQCSNPGGCDVGSGTLNLAWNDGAGGSGVLNFGGGYASPKPLKVGVAGLEVALLSGKIYGGNSFTVHARPPADTFQYTINREPHTDPVVIVSYNDPQGNHRFVTPINLTSPTENLIAHAGKMLHGGAGVEIVTSAPFTATQANTTDLVVQAPPGARTLGAHVFLEFIDPNGTVVREEAVTSDLEPGPNLVAITWNPADFNPAYDPAQDYIVMAFFTDWQGNIVGTAGRPLSSFQADPKPTLAFDEAGATWNFGSVAQGAVLSHTFTLGNIGLMNLKATVVGTGARADQAVPGVVVWTDTGLDVASGDGLGIRAKGTVCYATGGTTGCYGPDGSGTAPGPGWALPSASSLSLLARIGSGTPFYVGSAYVAAASASGRLYLGTNDCTGCYSDNGGSYQAHIEIQGLPTALGSRPSLSIEPSGATGLGVMLDTYYLPPGAFDRSVTVRTSDPDHPAQDFRVQGTIQPYVAPAQSLTASPYRPWDLKVAVSGDRAYRELVTFNDTIATDPASVQPLWVYDDTRQNRLGAGKQVAYATASGIAATLAAVEPPAQEDIAPATAPTDGDPTSGATHPSAVMGLEEMFGDGRDGVMPSSGNLDYNNGVGIGVVNSGGAGSYYVNVTDVYGVWRINPGDVVLIHQTQGSGAGCWEINKAVSDFGGGTATYQLAKPLQCNYTGGGNNHAQIQRVPQYTDCPVSGTVTPLTGWNGTWGGIFAVMCNGTMTVSGRVNVDGGAGSSTASWADCTESGGAGTGNGFKGGIGFRSHSTDNCSWWGLVLHAAQQGDSNVGPGAYSQSANGSGGGGGPVEPTIASGSGGGGGYGTAGTNGGGSDGASVGGYGGSPMGDAALVQLHLGGGGGGGMKRYSYSVGGGGSGAGIAFMAARQMSISGQITANGGNGGSADQPGGGGAGGAILLRAQNVDVGSARATALGGRGGSGQNAGGNGGVGRIRVEYCDAIAGYTNPAASAQKLICYGTITGKVWSDNNSSGGQDAGEPNMPSVTVTLSGVGTTTTAGDGTYFFANVVPGSYTVSVTPPTGFVNTTPGSVGVNVASNSTNTVNFGLLPRASVTGKVFHDANNNGSQGTGEAGVAGVTVTLSTGATRTTDANGAYTFADLMPGNYSVSVSVPDGYVNTTSMAVAVPLVAGQAGMAQFGVLMYSIEKVSGSDHANRFFIPETFRSGRRYWVQYGRSLAFAGAGDAIANVKLPKAHYSAASLEVLIVSAGAAFVRANLDVGNNGSYEWGYNANTTPPKLLSAANLAAGLNAFMSTASPDANGLVAVPIRLNLNTSGQVYLTNLVATPDGISDVSIAATDVGLNPATVIEGETVDVQATLRNGTPFGSGGLVVSFQATPAGGTPWYIGSTFVPNISAGDSYTARLAWDTLGFTGAVPVRVTVDPSGYVAETNEANNIVTGTVTIRTRPDLSIGEGLDWAFSDPEPVVGETVTVTLPIHNTGQTTAGTQTVALYEGNPDTGGVVVGTTGRPALPGGATDTVSFAWTPTTPGLHRLFARADRDQQVNESDEGNNDRRLDVYVGFGAPISMDSGAPAADPAYTPSLGYGAVDTGQADAVVTCAGRTDSTLRRDPSNQVGYRFDHLQPGRYYHLDVILYECDGLSRIQRVLVDDMIVGGPVSLGDQAEHRLSIRLDPALYRDHVIQVAVIGEEGSQRGAVVASVSLREIDYRYVDSGGADDLAYTAPRGWGHLTEDNSVAIAGTLPQRSARVNQGGPELRYRFDRLDPAKRYQVSLTFWQATGNPLLQRVRVDGLDTPATVNLVAGTPMSATVRLAPAAYATDGSVVVSVVVLNAGAGATVNEISLEEETLLTESPCRVRPSASLSLALGGVTVNGLAAPPGTVVTAENPRGDIVGCYIAGTDGSPAGQYGFMPIYGEDASASPPIPGMREGELVTFRVDGALAQATPLFYWRNDTTEHWTDLVATPLSGQSILLPQTWNFLSFRVAPPVPLLEAVLGSIAGKYDRVLGEEGFWSTDIPLQFRTLTELHAGRSYYLRLTVPSANLLIEGSALDVTTPLALHQHWNWVGYLPQTAMPVTVALGSIAGSYQRVLGTAGQFYDTRYPTFSTLKQMAPGEGYRIYATQAATLTYPTTIAAAAPPSAGTPVAPTGACRVTATPNMTFLFGGLTINDRPAPPGTLVEALTPRGDVAGCFAVETAGQYGFMALYGEDATTQPPIPGFRLDEPIRLRVNGLEVEMGAAMAWQADLTPHRMDLAATPHRQWLPLIAK